LGDHLSYSNGERLIPATDAKTSRQQFQRAFAQEFLCPFDALLEKINTTQPNDDDIAEAAAHFEVSPLMVRTTLVNKGELDRETLNWVG
jgi:Zn-dependent peptidase ImmA (M78 family)